MSLTSSLASPSSTACICSKRLEKQHCSSSPSICFPGTYQPSTGQPSCIDADSGYFVDTQGSSNQTACSPGTYQTQAAQLGCYNSNPGYYVSSSAANQQAPCPIGTYNPLFGATNVSMIGLGENSNTGTLLLDLVSKSCPPNCKVFLSLDFCDDNISIKVQL